jgi:hypothetical protein
MYIAHSINIVNIDSLNSKPRNSKKMKRDDARTGSEDKEWRLLAEDRRVVKIIARDLDRSEDDDNSS